MPTGEKRKSLKDMSAEEFFCSGLDSEDEEMTTDVVSHDENSQQPNKNVELGDKKVSHKDQLSSLENKDPEFYKFLKENEPELLEFDESDESLDESLEEEDDGDKGDTKSEKKRIKGIEAEKEGDINENSFEINSLRQSKKSGEVVTHDMLVKLKRGLKKMSLFSLRRIMRMFHAAVLESPESDKDPSSIQFNYLIESSSVFNSLVQICLKSVSGVLQHNLSIGKHSKQRKKLPLPSTSKSWSKIKVTVKCYLKDLLQLLRQLTEPEMLVVILKHVNELCIYYACFPKLAKMLIKRLVRMWSSAEEHVRVLAFISIRRISLIMTGLFDFVLKDSHQSIYNWQYICCIQLWSRILSEQNNDLLSPLIYPLVQVTLGVIRLVPTARFYPLHFHCIHALNTLSKSTNTYIPTASYLMEIFESAEFSQRAKPSMATVSDLSCILKLPKSLLHTRNFQDVILDNVCHLLLEYFVHYSTSIAFPELIFPVCLRMKRFMKKTDVIKFRKQIKQIVDKLQEAGHEVTNQRANVNFSPKDLDAVNKWELMYGQKKNSLQKFYDTWLKMRESLTTSIMKTTDGTKENKDTSPSKSKKKPVEREKKTKNSISFKEIALERNGNEDDDLVEDFHMLSSDDELHI
eukprot:gene9866-10876_t